VVQPGFGWGRRSQPFLFFFHGENFASSTVWSNRERLTRKAGYSAAAGFFAARPGFLLVVGGRPCKTIGGAAKALGCKRRRAQAATYQPTLKERIWQAFEGWQAASIVM